MSRNTFGPWSVKFCGPSFSGNVTGEKCYSFVGRAYEILSSDGRIVVSGDWNDRDLRDVELKARLIAAAPDLLDALIEMLAEKDEYMVLNNLGDPAKETVSRKARAAIAKATKS